MKDFMNIMKKAQDMQKRMEDIQAELALIEIQGSAGAGLVIVTLSGKGEMKGIKIDRALLNDEEPEILEDLIIAAHADAKQKSENTLKSKMEEITGGLNLPPGMNPFG